MTDGDKEIADFWASVVSTIKDADKLKKAMLKRGITQAKAKCPECEGYLLGVLAGPKKHLHMHCTGSCKRKMME